MSGGRRGILYRPGLAEALDRGATLPAEWYTSDTVFRLERDQIFRRAWQYVCLSERLARPGDFITAELGDVPIVLTRGDDGEIRAFANVCRHRGALVVREDCGNRKTLQCHYHAWTYNLDGSLRAAPASKEQHDFDLDVLGLISMRVETWGPFVFVNPDREAQPLGDTLGTLPDLVHQTGLDLDSIRRRVRRVYDIAANWKVVIDNYLECYHCPVAHPSFCDLIDVNTYEVTEYEHFSVQQGTVRKAAREGREPNLYDASQGVQDGFYAYLWPNFTLNIYPGPGNVSLNLFVPVGTHRTLAIYEYCFADSVPDTQVEDFTRFIDQVQNEDVALCESVQRGLGSGYFDHGKLMLSRENGLRHFQKLVYRYLTTDRAPVS